MKQQTRQSATPYSEEHITRWLIWLARGMTEHDQTIFLIEELQPSWLLTRSQRWVYLLASRLVWGILSGLIFGLIFELRDGLINGLLFGLLFGLIDAISTSNKHIRPAQNRNPFLWKILWVVVIFGLIGGLTYGMVEKLSSRLIVGLIVGLVWVLRGQTRMLKNEIETVETIRFLWTSFPLGFTIGSILGLIIGLTFGLSLGVAFGLIIALIGGLIGSQVGGLIGGLIGGLASSIRLTIRELKTIPNQGIWLSLRSAGLMGGVGGLALGLTVGLFGGWTNGLAYGALGGLCIGLWYGGLDVIQHFIVRFLLWRAGSLPWDVARFLDYAAEELHFLQKVGGGYIFVHRYLLEHFAAMETDDGGRQTAND